LSAEGDGYLDSKLYARIFRILEDCWDATSLMEFKVRLTESLLERYPISSTTFFEGETARSACLDPDPVVIGFTRRMVPEYQERWNRCDVFASAGAVRSFQNTRVSSLDELSPKRAEHKDYVSKYLWRHGVYTGAAMYLHLSDGHRALVGLFDRHDHALDSAELASLRLLARHLNRLSIAVPTEGAPASPVLKLTPRQWEVAHLIGEGLSNSTIAGVMQLQEDSVKKYVTRILAESGCRNRTELAIRVRSAVPIVRQPAT
jgi:DNA-binding CsgD family transcriptional regulator